MIFFLDFYGMYCENLNCFEFCIEGFFLCQWCLPTTDQIMSNYKKWNKDWYKLHGPKYIQEDDQYFATNCIMTARMLRKQFGFGHEYHLHETYFDFESLLHRLKKFHFTQVELIGEYDTTIHIFTIIGKFVFHTFQNEYELKITPINEDWMDALKTKNWSFICESNLDHDEVRDVRFYDFSSIDE